MISSSKQRDDIAESLAKLAKLHADGSLSDDEFKVLKAKLIAGAEYSKMSSDSSDALYRENRLKKSGKTGMGKIIVWELCIVGMIVGVFALFAFIPINNNSENSAKPYSGSAPLEVTTISSASTGVGSISVKNIGGAPITINDVTVNDRPDCTAFAANAIWFAALRIDGNRLTIDTRHKIWLYYADFTNLGNVFDPEFDRSLNDFNNAVRNNSFLSQKTLQVGEALEKSLTCSNTDAVKIAVTTGNETRIYHSN
jgi:hypothetical protein